MNPSKNWIGIFAAILSLSAIIPYIRGILNGQTKPERMSRIIWIMVGLILLASYYSVGARETLWIVIAYTVYPFIIFCFSIKYGVGGLTKLDIACFVGAALGALLWYFSHNATTALYIVACIDIIGFIPTINKTYYQPNTENRLAWQIGFAASVINLFAISNLRFEIAFYPIATVLVMSVMAILVTFPKLRLNGGRSRT